MLGRQVQTARKRISNRGPAEHQAGGPPRTDLADVSAHISIRCAAAAAVRYAAFNGPSRRVLASFLNRCDHEWARPDSSVDAAYISDRSVSDGEK